MTMLIWLAAAGVLVWCVVLFNLLVRDRNRVAAGWSDIDVQLKRRHDLVPRLVEAVRQYADYEQATLKSVTALRTESERTDDVGRKGELEHSLGDGVKRLVAVAEKYPDLKASNNFLDLQKELVDVEDHIQFARRYYNGAVRNFNTRVESFPDLLVAKLFGFKQRDFFQLDAESEAQVPEVKLQ